MLQPKSQGPRALALCVLCAFVSVSTGQALAQKAAVSVAATVSTEKSSTTAEPAPAGEVVSRSDNARPRRFMFNAKVGPSLCLASVLSGDGTAACSAHTGALQLEVGAAVVPNLYLVFPFQVQFRQQLGIVMLPLGVQYDIALPIKNLYFYPRASLGYAVFLQTSNYFSGIAVAHYGVAIPEFGIKYIVKGRVNLGIEPISVPLFFRGDAVYAYYRILIYAGFAF